MSGILELPLASNNSVTLSGLFIRFHLSFLNCTKEISTNRPKMRISTQCLVSIKLALAAAIIYIWDAF